MVALYNHIIKAMVALHNTNQPTKGAKEMLICYRDELGIVIEDVDEYGINVTDGKVYFNDKVIDVAALVSINEKVD